MEIKEMRDFNEIFKEICGDGTVMTVTTEDRKTISGIMYGNDEFYQVLVSGGKVYACYYQLQDGDNMGTIDYTHPYRVDDCTSDVDDLMNIKEIRKLSGLNVRQFCERYSIPYTTFHDWDTGKSNPPAYLIKLLARVVLEDFQ